MTTRRTIYPDWFARPRARPRSGSLIDECTCMPDLTCVSIDSTHMRVTFSVPVLMRWPTLQVGSYAFSPVLTPLAIAPGPVSPAGDQAQYLSILYVDVTTSEQTQGTNYTCVIDGLEVA